MSTEKASDRLARCLKAVEESPDSATAHFNLGLAYTQRNRMDRAGESYRKTLELDPDLVEAWVNLGGVLLLKWDFQGSLEANTRAVELKDDSLLAHFNLGQAHLYLGDAEGLVRCNRRVLELDPQHAAGHYFLAVGLLATNQVVDARASLSKAMSLGHRPQPEFLRGLDRAEGQAEQVVELQTKRTSRAKAPGDTKED